MISEELAALFDRAAVVDLSFELQEGIPSWSTHPHFLLRPWEEKRLGSVANHFLLCMGEHNGTHIDASYHFYGHEEGGRSIDEYDLSAFRGPCVTLDFDGCSPDFLLSRADIENWEAKNGAVKAGDIVLIHFGWGKKFAVLPEGNAYLERWPGVGKDAAEYLAARGIRMLGVDTFAADIWSSSTYDAHHALLSRDIPILEALNNLDQLPPRAYFLALPLRLHGGSGSPLRPIAIF